MFGNKLSEPRPFLEPEPAEQLAENAALAHAPQPPFIAADELMEPISVADELTEPDPVADELMVPVLVADELIEPVEAQGYNDNTSQLVVRANPSPLTASNKLVVGLILPNLHIPLNDWVRSELAVGLTSSKLHIPSNDRRG